MGIWYDVSLLSTGPVAIDKPFVKTKLNLPSTDTARLTITTELVNASDKKVKGVLKGMIEDITFSQKVTLSPGETKFVKIDPDKFNQLVIVGPRLWWSHNVGPQNLYDLELTFETGRQQVLIVAVPAHFYIVLRNLVRYSFHIRNLQCYFAMHLYSYKLAIIPGKFPNFIQGGSYL